MIWWIICLLPFLLILLFLGIEIKNHFSEDVKKVNQLPGPKEIPILGNLFDIVDTPDNNFIKMRKWSRKYYPIYKIWATNAFYSINMCAPEDMQIVLSNPIHNEKSDIYKAVHEWLREGLLTSKSDKWQQRRKILTPSFHFNILKRFIGTFNKHAAACVNDFKNDPLKEIEILPHISKSALHTIAETAMGINLTNSASEKKYRNSIYRMGEIIIYRILRPWMYIRLTHLFTYHFYEERFLLRYLQNFTKSVVKEREQIYKEDDVIQAQVGEDSNVYVGKKQKQLAMLDLLLSAKKQGQINDEGILEEVDTFMFEGHDTVSMSLQYTLMLLANHSDVQQKVYKEVTAILDNNREPTYENLNAMMYMEMVIKESLRLYPSVPIISRECGEEFTASSGHKIPAGSILVMCIYDTHRLEHIYPQPEKFIPERFTVENSKDRHPYAYLAFSAGSRNCIGKKYAMLNMKCKLAAIVKNFVLLPVTKPEDIRHVSDIVLRIKDKIKVQFIPRK